MQLIQWFTDFFAILYTNFRRTYFDYIHNIGNDQNFIFINAVLRVPSQQVPFFLDLTGATTGLHPDGYLPANISPYYLLERPVYTTDFVNFKLSDVVMKCTIFTNEGYKDVYVRVDPAQFEASTFSYSQERFATMANQLKPLNDQLQLAVAALQKTQNIEAINALKSNPAYIVKISAQCSDNSAVDIIAAVAWSQYEKLCADTATMQTLLKQVNDYQATAAKNEATEIPTTSTKKNNTLLYIIGGIAVLSLLSNDNGKD